MSGDKIRISVDGTEHQVHAGITAAAALLAIGVTTFRISSGGETRGPVCGMGICFECRATVDGAAHTRTCMIAVRDGMQIVTD